LRRRHGTKKGTRVCFVENGQDLILRPVTDGYIESIKGSLGSKGKAMKIPLQEKRREREL
jgi:bifunctional DNA-binding transcriptional regulator/antitoxin component of YhaV-PrlF toxin-antitoxin module